MSDTFSIYFPKGKRHLRDALEKLAKRKDRSINYIVLKAIDEYLAEEKQ